MASKVKKGFLYYIVWLAFIVVGIFCIFACILVFNPGKDVFGMNFRFVSDSSVVEYQKVDNKWFSDVSITDIEFNSGYTNFSVIRNSDYAITTLLVNKKIVGFSSSETRYAFNIDLTLDGTTLKITTTEPDLSIPFGPNATATLYCPKELNFNEVNFNVKTSAGHVNFGSQDDEFQTNIKNLNIETESGGINIQNNLKIASGVLNITSKNSTINIYNDITSSLNITTESSNVNITKISGNLNIEATELKVDCKKILGNINFSSEKGYFKVDELGNFTTQTAGNFTAEVDKMHIANIIIGKMTGQLTLPSSGASNITVTELRGEALINTTSGDVLIENAYNDLAITTESGTITATQNSEMAFSDIKTKNGKVKLTFNKIGTAEIESEKSNIEINVKDGLQFAFDYIVGKEIKISWITQSLQKSGSILSPTANNSTTNHITATTGESITMKNFQ